MLQPTPAISHCFCLPLSVLEISMVLVQIHELAIFVVWKAWRAHPLIPPAPWHYTRVICRARTTLFNPFLLELLGHRFKINIKIFGNEFTDFDILMVTCQTGCVLGR